MKKLSVLAALLVVAACSEQVTTPDVDAPQMTLLESLQQRGDPQTPAPSLSEFGPQFTIVVDPNDPSTYTYTFDDLPYSCYWNNPAPSTYEDLTFVGDVRWAVCYTPNGSLGFIPAYSHYYYGYREDLIQLSNPASSASLDVGSYRNMPLTLNAYDAGGNLVGSATGSGGYSWTNMETVTVTTSGAPIDRIGVVSGQDSNYIDNLTVSYNLDPQTKDDCKNGGWADYGFRNQGQCVRFVETGKDSR